MPRKKPAAAKKPPAKKPAAAKKKPAAKKPPAKPKAAVTFKEVKYAQDLIGRKVRMGASTDAQFTEARVVNVDLNAGQYVLKIRGKPGTFFYPMDHVVLQVV